MVKIKYIASSGSKLFAFRNFLVYSFFFLLIVVIFVNAITESVRTGSPQPLIEDIGGRLFYTTYQLEVSSNIILERGTIFDFSNGIFRGVWDSILLYSDFFSTIIITYFWIKFWAVLLARSPLSDTSRYFSNHLAGVLTFLVFQIVFILFVLATNSTILGIELDSGVFSNIALPFRAFGSFFEVVILIFSSLGDSFGDVLERPPSLPGGNITESVGNLSTQNVTNLTSPTPPNSTGITII